MGFELNFIKLNNDQQLKILEWIMTYDEPSEIISKSDKNQYKRTKWVCGFDYDITYYMGTCKIEKDHLASFLKLYKTLNIEKECIIESLYPTIFIKNIPYFAIIYEDLDIPSSAKYIDNISKESKFVTSQNEEKFKETFEIKDNMLTISKWLYKCPFYMITRIFSDPGSKYLRECYLLIPNALKPIKIETIMKRYQERTMQFIMNMVDGYYDNKTSDKEKEKERRSDTEKSIIVLLEEYKTFVMTSIIESYTIRKE